MGVGCKTPAAVATPEPNPNLRMLYEHDADGTVPAAYLNYNCYVT